MSIARRSRSRTTTQSLDRQKRLARALDESAVFADALQATGDPRGELLALELASHRAASWAEARALNRRAQQLRDAEGDPLWPEELTVRHAPGAALGLRAGFVVQIAHACLSEVAELDARADVGHVRALEDVSVFELPAHVQPTHLGLIPRYEPPPKDSSLAALGQLSTLRTLELHDPIDEAMHAQLAMLAQLEALQLPHSKGGEDLADLDHLALEHVELGCCINADLDRLCALPQLRSLRLRELLPPSPSAESGMFERLAGLRELEVLDVGTGGAAPNWRELLPQLERLRKLVLLPLAHTGDYGGWRRAHRSLAQLDGLEELGAASRFVDQELLDQLPALRRLELWTPAHEPERCRPRRGILPPLEHLSVTLPVLEQLRVCPSPSLRIVGDSEPEGSRRVWRAIASLGFGTPLRELEFVAFDPGPVPDPLLSTLACVEVLTLSAAFKPEMIEHLRRLPRLCRLRLVGPLPIAAHRAICQALPEILVETSDWWPRG